jgi:N-acetylglutamate synthase-like GNAT family acetyltransferase
MTTSQDFFNVFVVCPENGMENILQKIKKWFHENKTKHCWHIHSKIEKHFDLATALSAARQKKEHSILIPIGFQPQAVKMKLDVHEKKNLEVIIRPPRPTKADEKFDLPLSSLLVDSCTVAVQNTLPAIHKSVLRKHFSKIIKIRTLQSESDFLQYFKLRYTVWNEMGYLAAEKQCTKSQFELDYTDRTALPIGIFNPQQQLIASARLVFPSGYESYHMPLIQRMINATQDEQLKKNFAYPKVLKHPFDLLECFSGFNEYFASLVRNGVRNAEVSRVIVAPEYRHSGLGEVLVDSLISAARQEQLQLLFLACKKHHHGFYEQCGFKRIAGIESECFANIHQQSIAMSIEL